jgi:hypothetical protein
MRCRRIPCCNRHLERHLRSRTCFRNNTHDWASLETEISAPIPISLTHIPRQKHDTCSPQLSKTLRTNLVSCYRWQRPPQSGPAHCSRGLYSSLSSSTSRQKVRKREPAERRRPYCCKCQSGRYHHSKSLYSPGMCNSTDFRTECRFHTLDRCPRSFHRSTYKHLSC